MPRRKKEKMVVCKKCGYSFRPNEVEPNKTWQMVAPMPDKEGRITVTIMAVWTCPNCGAKIRGTYSKIKVGHDIKGTNRTQILIETLNSVESIKIRDVAEKIKVSEETARKAIQYLINKGKISGRIEGDTYYRI